MKGPAKDPKRSAVVCLPVLALQLLWKRRPAWRGHPVAVVEDESADAPLLLLSRVAERRGLRPGLSQGAARNLVPDLRTGVVSDEELAAGSAELLAALNTFSPRVEREPRFTGCYFVDPEGLGGIYGGYDAWAETVHRYLRGRKLIGSVVVGFERYRALGIARTMRGPLVLPDPKTETERSGEVSLRKLGFPESLCDPLAMLDVETLGAFTALPAGELQTRFGALAADLHSLFGGTGQLPLQPARFDPPRRRVIEVAPPTAKVERLLFTIKRGLDGLLTDLDDRGERLRELTMTFHLERWGRRKGKQVTLEDPERVHVETIEPASPLDGIVSLMDLVRLRLESTVLLAPVEELVLEAEAVPMSAEQLVTPGDRPARDRGAANRALARLRATFGAGSVRRMRLRDAHLPEAQFVLEPMPELTPPGTARKSPEQVPLHEALLTESGLDRRGRRRRPLQRRLLPRPEPLPTDRDGGPRLPRALLDLQGPQKLSGGWWGRREATERDYYYAETEGGGLYWVYWDRPRSRWYLHGHVD